MTPCAAIPRPGNCSSEFARCFKGRRQLFWSKGLKEYLGIVDEADEAVASSEVKPEDTLVYSLSNDDWVRVCRGNLRGELLDICRPVRTGWVLHLSSGPVGAPRQGVPDHWRNTGGRSWKQRIEAWW